MYVCMYVCMYMYIYIYIMYIYVCMCVRIVVPSTKPPIVHSFICPFIHSSFIHSLQYTRNGWQEFEIGNLKILTTLTPSIHLL